MRPIHDCMFARCADERETRVCCEMICNVYVSAFYESWLIHVDTLCKRRIAFIYATFVERSLKLVKAKGKRRSFSGAQTHKYLAEHVEKLSEEDQDRLVEELEVGSQTRAGKALHAEFSRHLHPAATLHG